MTSILVIDDDQDLCRTIAEILSGAGYETRMVYDGQKALQVFAESPADIVLTDIYMPECDGLEVLRTLHRISPSTCIVVMSGHDSTDELDYLRAAKTFGATAVLSKPFRSAELLNAIAACSPEDI